ncbi:protein phosphatase 2c-related protein, putative [Ichthyophthirius multifiliis]|uniref:Protein phosphatase n=1 Tax=Ichthyophthirius multifiliis TaxID=5932 RepID=G0R5Y2_ICHMU|nr:protein phosphatase 2c-related protein, putative [Ichthyophthirius multifiliis]EGR27106.1 protein phosphatase 2c-related protein, putative [Ichthyophthirius multifiliis]|eukprot:XP_004023990.1 protein phosphatase 2c-related protein, putative [Ichthyophthirius multifiliis]
MPYQIGQQNDDPDDSIFNEHDIQNNDILVMGSDGLFDNLDQFQIYKCIRPFWQISDNIQDIQIVCDFIAKYAFKLSRNPTYQSPYAIKCKQNYKDYRGGKQDDISVIVAQIQIPNKQQFN